MAATAPFVAAAPTDGTLVGGFGFETAGRDMIQPVTGADGSCPRCAMAIAATVHDCRRRRNGRDNQVADDEFLEVMEPAVRNAARPDHGGRGLCSSEMPISDLRRLS